MWLIVLAAVLLVIFWPPSAHAKGGGSSTYSAYSNKPASLTALENSFYNIVNPLVSQYGDLTRKNLAAASGRAATADKTYDTLAAQAPGLLDQARTAGDEWYGRAGSAADIATSSVDYSKNINKFYGDMAQDQLGRAQQVANTGEIPEAIAAALRAETDRGLNNSLGSSLANLASRGVLNSSVTNKGVADLSQAAGDAYNRNYLNAFNTVLGGYQGNASTAAATGSQLADTALNINNNALGLAESLARIGSGRTSDLLSVLGANQAERQGLLAAVPQFYSNAAAPLAMANNFLQQQQQDFWNTGKQDTVVKQGK
jgi:hypothetical protein